MEKQNKEELLKKVDELVSIIKNSNDYKRYIELKTIMENSEIMPIINKIKKVQRESIKNESRGINTLKLEEEIVSLKKELDSYPIYREYTYLQEDLNNDFQNIKKIIEDIIKY